MKNFKNIPIPNRMKNLPLDKRGYPISVIVLLDSEGRPHFTINNEEKRQKLLREDKCGICGGKLFRFRWSVGGPLSAFHEHGAYLDGPMHEECYRYAMQVCPYLAAPSYAKRIDDKTLDYEKLPDAIILSDQTMIDNRPDPFVGLKHEGQTFTYWDDAKTMIQYVFPKKHIGYEYWSKGERLDQDTGHRMAMEYIEQASAKYLEE